LGGGEWKGQTGIKQEDVLHAAIIMYCLPSPFLPSLTLQCSYRASEEIFQDVWIMQQKLTKNRTHTRTIYQIVSNTLAIKIYIYICKQWDKTELEI